MFGTNNIIEVPRYVDGVDADEVAWNNANGCPLNSN